VWQWLRGTGSGCVAVAWADWLLIFFNHHFPQKKKKKKKKTLYKI
jgi:hypothetical protein